MRSVKRPAKTCCCYQLPLHSSVEENLQWEGSLNRVGSKQRGLFLKGRVIDNNVKSIFLKRKRKQSWQNADPTPRQLPQLPPLVPAPTVSVLSARTLHDEDGVSFSSFTVSGGIFDGSPLSSHLRV